MKILLTGANGYIGARLLPRLVYDGHEIYALVRRSSRIEIPEKFQSQLHVIEADLLNPSSLLKLPADLNAAYYLVHSMSYWYSLYLSHALIFSQLAKHIAKG